MKSKDAWCQKVSETTPPPVALASNSQTIVFGSECLHPMCSFISILTAHIHTRAHAYIYTHTHILKFLKMERWKGKNALLWTRRRASTAWLGGEAGGQAGGGGTARAGERVKVPAATPWAVRRMATPPPRRGGGLGRSSQAARSPRDCP